MKTLTANAQAEIAKAYGTEPISIVEIIWESGGSSFYADRLIDGIPAKFSL